MSEPNDEGMPPTPPGCRRVFHTSMVLLAFGMVAVVGGPTLIQACEERRLLEEGVDATATIILLEDTRDTINDRPVVRLTVDVHAEGREPWRAQIVTPLSPVDLQNYRVGVQVRVRYDAQDPRKVALVGPLPAQ